MSPSKGQKNILQDDKPKGFFILKNLRIRNDQCYLVTVKNKPKQDTQPKKGCIYPVYKHKDKQAVAEDETSGLLFYFT